jgi:hypothetical protein
MSRRCRRCRKVQDEVGGARAKVGMKEVHRGGGAGSERLQ